MVSRVARQCEGPEDPEIQKDGVCLQEAGAGQFSMAEW